MKKTILVLMTLASSDLAADPTAVYVDELATCTTFYHVLADNLLSENKDDADAVDLARVVSNWADHLSSLVFTHSTGYAEAEGHFNAAADQLRAQLKDNDLESFMQRHEVPCGELAEDPDARRQELQAKQEWEAK